MATKTDALARRSRFAPPNPDARPKFVNDEIVLVDADYALFDELDEFQYLPSHYLAFAIRHLRKSKSFHLNRLTELFNGSKADTRYLSRPAGQFAGSRAKYQHVVYGLTRQGKQALAAKRGALCAVGPSKSTWFVHQLFQACIVFCIKHTAELHGFKFVGRSSVLTHRDCGQAKGSPQPMAIEVPGTEDAKGRCKRVIPDDLFALEKPQGKRFFLLEADRDTESVNPDNDADPETATTYFRAKLSLYFKLFMTGAFRAWWGFATPRILIVTTNPTRAKRILNEVKRFANPRFENYFYVTVEEDFGADWRVPKSFIEDLITRDWMTVNGPRKITD